MPQYSNINDEKRAQLLFRQKLVWDLVTPKMLMSNRISYYYFIHNTV